MLEDLNPEDVVAVAALLGREPRGSFKIAARDSAGAPTVIKNEPFLHDGEPMPTFYWLVGAKECRIVGRLESTGGVREAEREIDAEIIAEMHTRYASEREAMITADHEGPRPSGGVGGTRKGVKCLHTHYANYLAGWHDPVGIWVQKRLKEMGEI